MRLVEGIGTYRFAYGEVFTRRWVVDTILDLVGYDIDCDLGARVIIEPSVGTGAFLVPIVERLLASATKHDRPLWSLGEAIRGFDLQGKNIIRSCMTLRPLLLDAGMRCEDVNAMLRQWLAVADFLLVPDLPMSDFVVGNPPYIRLEDVDAKVSDEYRRRCPTMRGRADIYVGFYERSLGLLRPEGRLGFICADRWMRNQYGAPLRQAITRDYSVESVWTMHDVDVFEAQVSAYPAITILRRSEQAEAVVAETNGEFNADSAKRLTEWTLKGSSIEFSSKGFEAHRLDGWFSGDEMWAAGNSARIALMEYLNERFHPLQDPETGTRVSIGVATGADKTYVVKSADVEPDRLLPLAMVEDLRENGEFVWGGNYLVNPWAQDGELVKLDEYPKLRAYYEEEPKLRERHTAKNNRPEHWFRTIDKVAHSLIFKPKLLIQDMRVSMNPVLEPGGYYPHHNLYHITSNKWDLEVLGGILLSNIGQAFIEAYSVRMRGGTLRFQAQYLKKIRVPKPDGIRPDAAERLRVAFRSRDIEAATAAAADVYHIDPVLYGLVKREKMVRAG